jgi:hypothetical protein
MCVETQAGVSERNAAAAVGEYNRSDVSKACGWHAAYDLPERLEPVSLIVAIRTDSQIILAADSLSLEGDAHTGADVPFSVCKLHRVAGTDWIMASIGHAAFDTFKREIEAEIALGQRPAFDPHLSVGGPMLFRALREKAREAGAPDSNFPQSWVILAGFDLENKPLILSANPPLLGYRVAEPITVLGAQWPTASWILYTLAASCGTIEMVRKLAVFAVWEISKRELKVGSIEAGYAIHSCVMEFGKPHEFIETTSADLDVWLKEWETGLRDSFADVIEKVELKPKPSIPESSKHGP